MKKINIFVQGLVGSNYPMKKGRTDLCPLLFSTSYNQYKMNQKEIWEPIPDYEGFCEVSDYGRVRSIDRIVDYVNGRNHRFKGRILLQSISQDGYPTVGLSKDGKQKIRKVHQLVAIVFLNHTPCGMNMVVNHKNFIRNDNRVTNLEIITNRENSNKKHLKSSSIFTGVSWNKGAKKWRAQITVNRKNNKHLGYFTLEKEASKAYEAELDKIEKQ